MASVYILESKKNGRYYIGSATNIEKRVGKHKRGEVHTTKRFLPIELVFKQDYSDIKIAKKIEYKLKRLKRKDYLQKIVKNSLITLR